MTTQEKKPRSFNQLIFFVIAIPVIVYLVQFSIKKNNESESRGQVCREDCSTQGYPGHEFKWAIFSGPQCVCLGERDLAAAASEIK